METKGRGDARRGLGEEGVNKRKYVQDDNGVEDGAKEKERRGKNS